MALEADEKGHRPGAASPGAGLVRHPCRRDGREVAGNVVAPSGRGDDRGTRGEGRMRYVSHLACTACGTTYPSDRVMNLCERDGRPVQMVFDLERLRAERGRAGGWD